MEKLKVLVCDDDKAIVDAISIYLKQENYEVIKAYNGLEVLDIIKRETVHLIILDLMMPKMDGMTTMLKVREKYNIPILVLSAKSENTDKVMGLNFGADDYVTKPFNPLELLARVKSQTRRYTTLGSMTVTSSVIRTEGLVVDRDAKEVFVDGEKKQLTPTEFRIITFLMEHLGSVFSSEQIYENVWNEPSFSVENTVAVHIRRIREKIEINPKEPKYLKVVWGIGYKIEKY